jgi:ADP-ribose pyrophosphatase YjhB (NUDIX family)
VTVTWSIMKSLVSKLYRRTPPVVTRALLFAVNATFNVSVAGMFLDSEDKVLLARHVFRHRYPWGLPGGFLAAGEGPETAALRELKEELGLAGSVDTVLGVNVITPRHLEIVVAGRADSNAALRLSAEIFEARFFALDALPEGLPPDQSAWIRRVGAIAR